MGAIPSEGHLWC